MVVLKMPDRENNKNNVATKQYAHKRLYRYHQTLSVHIQLFLSMASSCLVLIGVAYWLNESNIETYKILAIINCMTIFIVFQMIGVYHQSSGILLGRRRTLLFGLWVLSKAWCVVIIVMALYIYLIDTFNVLNLEVLIIWSVVGFFIQAG